MLGTFAEVSDQMRDLFYQGFTRREIEAFESALERILANLARAPGPHPPRR